MTDNEAPPRRKMNGCAWALLAVLAPIALALVFIVLRILWMFGSWIGQQ